MSKRTKWIVVIVVVFAIAASVVVIAGLRLSRRLGPYLREQTIAYLEDRFDATVELGSLQITSPAVSPWGLFFSRGRGLFLEVTASGIRLRHQGRTDIPPIVTMKQLKFDFEVASAAKAPLRIRQVRIDGFELVIPPKGQRPKITGNKSGEAKPKLKSDPVFVDEINLDGMRLVILPKKEGRAPLEFDMKQLRVLSVGARRPLQYQAILTNPKPPGLIDSNGTFGPFDAEDPGESPVTGSYVFQKADLSVFKSIAGILHSTGKFDGRLNQIIVDGEATVPDFRLNAVRNVVPLHTKFHAIVDGTNGDTILQPVNARLGKSDIWVQGAVERRTGESGKTVALTAISKNGHVEDFLRLAVKGERPPIEGGIGLTVKLIVPPGKEDYAKRLAVSGTFELNGGRFTSTDVQTKLDDLSRRAQGKPNDATLERIPSDFAGAFDLQHGVLKLHRLLFQIAGAELEMAGTFDMENDLVDFAGPVRTQARVSQMVKSRWKRILLKPVDPIFAKDGAGALFYLQVKGTRDKPEFKVGRKAPEAKK
ncbi:MAG: hypothetical protein JST93_30885 [Acidobacteria bacterium]|nr:hypothetical protein [Acidobacteriota bacterium]